MSNKSYLPVICFLIFSTISAQQFTLETSGKKKSRVKCVSKFKKYDDNELNSFLKNSYELCDLMSTSANELDNINDFIEDPVGWMIEEVKKSRSPYAKLIKRAIAQAKNEITQAQQTIGYAEFIVNNPEIVAEMMIVELERRINDYILRMLIKALNDGKESVSGSKTMVDIASRQRNIQKKLSGVQDVANAIENYNRGISYFQKLQKELKRALNNLDDLSSGKMPYRKQIINDQVSNDPIGIRVFSDSDYSGEFADLKFNNYPNLHKSANDKITSIEVYAGAQVVIYSDGNFKGRSKILTESQQNLNNFDFNDKISSLKVQDFDPKNEPYVYVFYDKNYKGRYNFFGLGEYSSIWPNDRISSIQIRDGYEVVIYEHGDFKGKSYTLKSEISDLKKIRFDDKTSSLKVKNSQ